MATPHLQVHFPPREPLSHKAAFVMLVIGQTLLLFLRQTSQHTVEHVVVSFIAVLGHNTGFLEQILLNLCPFNHSLMAEILPSKIVLDSHYRLELSQPQNILCFLLHDHHPTEGVVQIPDDALTPATLKISIVSNEKVAQDPCFVEISQRYHVFHPLHRGGMHRLDTPLRSEPLFLHTNVFPPSLIILHRQFKFMRSFLQVQDKVHHNNKCRWKPVINDTVISVASGEPGSIPDGGCSQIFACGNRARRCSWSAGFLTDFPFLLPLHCNTAPYTHFHPHVSVKSRPNLCTPLRSIATCDAANTKQLTAKLQHRTVRRLFRSANQVLLSAVLGNAHLFYCPVEFLTQGNHLTRLPVKCADENVDFKSAHFIVNSSTSLVMDTSISLPVSGVVGRVQDQAFPGSEEIIGNVSAHRGQVAQLTTWQEALTTSAK
ncbi:hypothetical protein PR048_021499 [Dryococelus australis]|uniref:Uncharacterized protein n=1 Tax=Dryococelus australis TaxID=614101 RepID=A0ABQ9GYG1_9NEOP|nr:hypothetical protein PR048_021499 [Dryococelus australis]